MELSAKEQLAREKICLPLDDLDTLSELEQRVRELSPVVGMFKLGKGSFTRFGREAVSMIQPYARVFLDLKYHDIPNTVYDAAKAAAELGVYLFDVHASGGKEMMQAAVQGAREGAERKGTTIPKIVGVTVLTSVDQNILNEQLRVPGNVEEQVFHLAELARQSGLDGVVCSARDLYAIKKKLPQDFLYVTPGISGISSAAGPDQKRVMSPGEAVREGSSVLVIGRAITGKKSYEARMQAGRDVLSEIAKYI